MTRAGTAALAVCACLLAIAGAAPSAAPGALLDDVMESLYRVMRFLLAHPQDLIVDTVFGVVVAKGQLRGLQDQVPKYPDRFVSTPSRRVYVLLAARLLETMCEEVAMVAPPEPPENTTYKMIADRLLQFQLWEMRTPMRSGMLMDTDAYRRWEDPLRNYTRGRALTLEQYATVLLTGTPNELQSDHCIVELLNSSSSSSPSSSSCEPSEECRRIEERGRRPTGYATTHRLLYLQIARQVGCGGSPYFANTAFRIAELCAAILREAEFIASLGVPAPLEDIFIEQVTLCGIEGFAEFVRPEWIRKIMSLQRPEGCYGGVAEMTSRTESSRVKRNDLRTAHGCMMHETGLAAAALSLSARALVEMRGL
ncbi:UPF0764 protein C16orf89 homolog [Bacillus rossius redtenbacheri]|uniref:UPF0764 protein C16orf89 homolog n=1 Tax=Bacillus rossius redtenbacheri TaxID=93214 RepID=UPI002FDDD39E